MRNTVTEEEIQSFIASAIPSVWALELLLRLFRTATHGQKLDDLVADLRSSHTAVSQALIHLHNAGLVVEDSGRFSYIPASPKLDELVKEVEKLYARKPLAVVKAITTARNEKLQRFTDSFKLRDEP